MKIVNGRWVDDNQDPINDLNFNKFKELSKKVHSVYGKKITYDRIEVISSIVELNEKQDVVLTSILSTNKTLSLLA
jgi:hypothetical protein